MKIEMSLIVKLRDESGAGLSAVKKALEETNCDYDAALMLLRKAGVDKAAKKADRPTGQGVIAIKYADCKCRAVIIELNCEQDPTTQNERFLAFLETAENLALKNNCQTAEEVLAVSTPEGTLADTLKELIGIFSENVQLKRCQVVDCPEGGVIGSYIHFNNKAGAVIALKLDGCTPESMQKTADDICMHAVATRPLALTRDGVPAKLIEQEKEVFMEEVSKKPEAIRENILNGKMSKFFAEKVLLEQIDVLDPEGKTTIQAKIDNTAKEAGGKAEVVTFIRYELGL